MFTTTLNRPIIVVCNNSLEPTLMLIMMINVGHNKILPMLNVLYKLAWVIVIVF